MTQKPILLDFGSSYGHLLVAAKKRGFNAIGIEINEYLIKYTREKGFTVHGKLSDIQGQVHVVAMIDSLYCTPEPIEIFARLRGLLDEDGALIIRITNRNWLLKMKKNILRSNEFNHLLGDATIGYSLKSLSLLLEKTGFVISKTIFHEKGKKMPIKKRLFYFIAAVISSLSRRRFIVSPGIIVVAKKIPSR